MGIYRIAIWFLANNKILTGRTAAVAFCACFSKFDTPEDPERKKYLDKNPILGRVT
jgi:hypothetical protein